jgi:hypothetical protein
MLYKAIQNIITALFLCSFNAVIAQNWTTAQIKGLKISQINSVVKTGSLTTGYISFYNKDGLIVKKIRKEYKNNFGSDSSAFFFTYIDTLLVKEEGRAYFKGKLVETFGKKCNYEFDGSGRVVSKIINEKNGRVQLEKYAWNDKNLADTVYFFNNDTTISTPKNRSHLSYGKEMKMKIFLLNYWDNAGKLIKTIECKTGPSWIKDSERCETVSYYKNGDTAIKETNYWRKDFGKVTIYSNEVLISDNETLIKDEMGNKTTILTRWNEKRLPVEILWNTLYPNGQSSKSSQKISYLYRK